MSRSGVAGGGWGVDKERPQKRRAEVAFDYPKASAQDLPKLWEEKDAGVGGKAESPAGVEVQRGGKTGRSARYSPSPQPLGLHYPQAGFAGARPSGKVKKSNGKRY